MKENSNLPIKNLPEDLNAEVLLNYYPAGTFKVEYKGLHKRNTYKDILVIDRQGTNYLLSLGRNSIYNALPEYLFHSIDRFDLPQYNQKERFEEEYIKQEQEKEDAYRFFEPIDLMLLQLRLKIRKILDAYTCENKILQDLIADNLTQEQQENRFIKQTIPYLPTCKHIRGDRTLITLMLRKILTEENLSVNIHHKEKNFTDKKPRYSHVVGMKLGEGYAGNTFTENILVYDIKYWSEENCNQDFIKFVEEIEVFRQFIQDYFLSVDSLLSFDIQTNALPIRLSDTTTYNYLNFNTNL